MLSVEHVTKSFGRHTVLDDVNLSFESGVYGLLAPNGAGKTTLIRMLVTLAFPTSGQILWKGEDICGLGEEYRGLIGYLPQDFGYYPSYTPRRFLRYVAALQRVPRKQVEARVDELLDLVSLTQVADKKMRQFSGGMIQRVGIAQAMMGDPRIIVLDEPTAGLDPRERVRFRNLIHGLAQDRIVILSTHIVSDVETIAGKIILIKDGCVQCCESSASVCADLEGKVFEVPADTPLPPGALLLSEREGANGALVRVLADACPAGGVPVAASLEDAFLSIYRDNAIAG